VSEADLGPQAAPFLTQKLHPSKDLKCEKRNLPVNNSVRKGVLFNIDFLTQRYKTGQNWVHWRPPVAVGGRQPLMPRGRQDKISFYGNLHRLAFASIGSHWNSMLGEKKIR
jgi:hypothetical protein